MCSICLTGSYKRKLKGDNNGINGHKQIFKSYFAAQAGNNRNQVSSIDKEGLLSKSRLYVHLSKDTETAVKVGSRHGKPVVYRVAAGKMTDEGYEFFLSVNGVWLVKAVPAEYLSKL